MVSLHDFLDEELENLLALENTFLGLLLIFVRYLGKISSILLHCNLLHRSLESEEADDVKSCCLLEARPFGVLGMHLESSLRYTIYPFCPN